MSRESTTKDQHWSDKLAIEKNRADYAEREVKRLTTESVRLAGLLERSELERNLIQREMLGLASQLGEAEVVQSD